MLDLPEASRPAEDDGCLRWVLAVPLAILNLIAAWFLSMALTIRPSGSWDDDARAGIVLSCVLTLATSGLALAITVVPAVRRVMGPWWAAPPLVLGAAAAIRWALVG
jgi:ABC-type sulfate transport system permease component